MDQKSFFSGAAWVGAAPVDGKTPAFSVLRGHFEAKKGEKGEPEATGSHQKPQYKCPCGSGKKYKQCHGK